MKRHSDEFAKYDYGTGHPLKPFRLKLTYELIRLMVCCRCRICLCTNLDRPGNRNFCCFLKAFRISASIGLRLWNNLVTCDG